MLLPNKKLLKEVLKDRFKDVVIDGCVISEKNDNTLKIFMNICFCYEINIYELAHKCKEWAISKGYYLYSVIVNKEAYAYITYPCNTSLRLFSCHSYTEPEAIFKACEYIMEKIKWQKNNLCKTTSNKKSL